MARTHLATGRTVGEVAEIDGRLRIVRIGEYEYRNGKCCPKLRWYCLMAKEIRTYLKGGKLK